MVESAESSERSERSEAAEWRVQLGERCESAFVHVGLMVLLLIDVNVIAMEFLLKGTACDQAAADAGAGDDGLSSEQVAVMHVLHAISVSILLVFALHLVIEMVAFGAEFFKSVAMVLDVCIITTALFFELSGVAKEKGDWVMILMLSRVVRVVHAVVHTIELQHEQTRKAVEKSVHETGIFENELRDSSPAALATEVERIASLVWSDNEAFCETAIIPDDIAALDDVTKLRLLLAEERKLRLQIIAGDL